MPRRGGAGYRGGSGGRGKQGNNVWSRSRFNKNYQFGNQQGGEGEGEGGHSSGGNYRRDNRRGGNAPGGVHRRVGFSDGKNYKSRNQGRNNSYRADRNDRDRMTYRSGGRGAVDPEAQWSKIVIPNARQMDKQFLVSEIQSNLDLPFSPYNFHADHNTITFFVLGQSISDTLRSLNRRLSSPSGGKIMFQVNPSSAPPTPINDELIEVIKTRMSARYDAELKLLDMAKFHEDDQLRQLGIFVGLNRPNLLHLITRIITENIPDIMGVNLSANRIAGLEPLGALEKNCKFLKAIDLSTNQIKSAAELDHLKGLEITEIILDGNPFRDTFDDQAAYISCVRSCFSKLTKLDGDILPAQIGFAVAETSNLPASQGGHIPDDVKQFIYQFFEAFYNIYDTDDRQQLLQAYHDQAFFSMSLARFDNTTQPFHDDLIYQSRNLLRLKDYSLRSKLIKQGKLNIVSALNELPRTKHDADSFVIDVPVYNNTFVNVVVNGVFREFSSPSPSKNKHKQNHHHHNNPTSQLRSFCRTFFIVPQGAGFVIINDLLLLTNASHEQIQKYGKSSSLLGSSGSSTSALDMQASDHSRQNISRSSSSQSLMRSTSSSGHLNIVRQVNNNEAVINNFMSTTGMNRAFAVQCLSEYQYDYEKAIGVFHELSKQNAIPPEAFS